MKKKLIDAFCDVVSLILIAAALNNFYLADHGIGVVDAIEIQIGSHSERSAQMKEEKHVQVNSTQNSDEENLLHEHTWVSTYEYDWIDHEDGTGHVTMKEILSCTCGISKPIKQVEE